MFLDTFPYTAGFAAIESMAKGKPVFSLECESLKFYGLNRIQRLIFDSQDTLIISLLKASTDTNFYNEISTESSEFVENRFYDLNKLTVALDEIIN